MRLDVDIELIAEKVIRTKERTKKTVKESRTVEARLSSPTRAEYYAGAKVGLAPAAVFDVHSHEYEGEKLLRHGDTLYTIVRTYRREVEGLELTELTCEEKAANSGKDK